jgi:dCMP deaminase
MAAMGEDSIVEVKQQVTKREGVLSWDDFFMSIAWLVAMRSKDPTTQVGACIVNEQNRIVGVGYNGFPSGISDDALPWAKKLEGWRIGN